MRLIVTVSRALAEKVKSTSVGDDEPAPTSVVDVPTGIVAAGVTEAAVVSSVGNGVDVSGVVIAGLVTGAAGSVDELPSGLPSGRPTDRSGEGLDEVVATMISAAAGGGTKPGIPAVAADGAVT